MKLCRSILMGILLLPAAAVAVAGDALPRASTLDARVADLLSRMTLEEKIAQLDMLSGRPFTETGGLSDPQITPLLGSDGVGSIHDFYPATPDQANALQARIIQSNRLGIPALFVEETLHGYVQAGSTAFPVPLALAATWNAELVEGVGAAIAAEARAMGTHVGLSPVLGIARDARWGRVEETFGEDPFLTGRLGQAMVEGFQGQDLSRPDAVAAVVKHFAVHSVPRAGANSSPAGVGRREALQFFLEPFRQAIVQAGARGVMTAYSEWDGIPCTGDAWLLGHLLRDTWGFSGFTLADMGAVRMLSTCHFTTQSAAASLQRGLAAGVDMQFYDFPSADFRAQLKDLVQQGRLEQAAIDRAAGDVLRLKLELGLFDHPFVDPDLAANVVHGAAQRDRAREAARQSVILLKNDTLLPLGPGVTRIAVVGPAADSDYPGGYSPRQARATTLLEGLRSVAGPGMEIRHVQGVSFLDEGVPVPGHQLRTVNGEGSGLDAAYFANDQLAGAPALTRVDPALDFQWDTHAPAEGLPPDGFSVRWDGWLEPTREMAGWIGLSSDDGSRLWLDGKLVIDAWETGVTIRRHRVRLEAGSRHRIRVEYRENMWGASASLRWSQDADDVAAAVDLARWADVVVAAVGENGMLVGENRDRLALELSGRQSDLVAAVAATGKPVVLVVISGRPVALHREEPLAGAMVAGFFGGEAAGTALARVLLGKDEPGGRTPISWPRHTGQIPCFYNHKPSRVLRYVDGDARPLFPFGHGLSFADFTYGDLRLQEGAISAGDTLRFSLTVENTANRAGRTTVQVYVNDRFSSVTTPVQELKDFRGVELAAGQKRRIRFAIPASRFFLYDEQLQRRVEAGDFDLMVGASSADIRLRGQFQVLPGQR